MTKLITSNISVSVTEKSHAQYHVSIAGRIEADNAHIVQGNLCQIVNNARSITIDCRNLEYVSSAGLRVFLLVQKNMPDKRRLHFTNISDNVRGIFRVTGFDQIMQLEAEA